MLPCIFLLPLGSTTKLILGAGILVGQVLLLDMLVEILPVNNITVPRLAMYYLTNIVLISLSLIVSYIIVCLWNKAKRNGSGVPGLVAKIFLGGISRLLGVKINYMKDKDGDDAANKIQMAPPAEWFQLSVVLDRLFAIIFLLVAVITVFVLLTDDNRD